MTTQATPTRRIVVGVDGSACSIAALDWALRQAELTGAVVEALTMWEWPNTYGVALVVPEGYDPEADARTVLEDSLTEARESHPDTVIRPSSSTAIPPRHWSKRLVGRISSSWAAAVTESSPACCSDQ
jgi:nucleotide-binding universal stress UspA family protein